MEGLPYVIERRAGSYQVDMERESDDPAIRGRGKVLSTKGCLENTVARATAGSLRIEP